MELLSETALVEKAVKETIIEIKLYINRKLYENGSITEEMFSRARELILKP